MESVSARKPERNIQSLIGGVENESPPKKGNKRVNKNNRTVSDTKERECIFMPMEFMKFQK